MAKMKYYNGSSWEVLDAKNADTVGGYTPAGLPISTATQTALNAKAEKSSGSGSIPTTDWTANTGDYALKVNVAVTGMLATDYAMVDIANDAIDLAQAAELSPNVTEYAGGLTFYCKTTPTSAISFNWTKLR